MPGPLQPAGRPYGRKLRQTYGQPGMPPSDYARPNLGRRMVYKGGLGSYYGEHLDAADSKSAAAGAAGAAGAGAGVAADAKAAGAGLLESYEGYLNQALVWLGVAPVDLVKEPALRDIVWAVAPFAAAYVAVEHEKVANQARAYGVPVPQAF